MGTVGSPRELTLGLLSSCSILMTDDLKAYPCVSSDKDWKRKKMSYAWVSHGKYEFTDLVELKEELYQAGTQKLDGMWGNLKDDLRTKRGVNHEHLGEEMRLFQWFYVRGEQDPLLRSPLLSPSLWNANS